MVEGEVLESESKKWAGGDISSPVAIRNNPSLTNFAMVAVTSTGQRSLVVCCSPTREVPSGSARSRIIWLTSSPEVSWITDVAMEAQCVCRLRPACSENSAAL